jgi:5'-3' exonuclease
MNDKTLILCDYSWMTHRFAHVHKGLSVTYGGKEYFTGIAYGFAQYLQSVDRRINNADIIFCLDDRSEERLAIDENYKANREHKAELYETHDDISAILCNLDYVYFAEAEGKEADDVMAMSAIHLKDKYKEVIVYTGDSDLLQLVSLGIKVGKKFSKTGFEYLDDNYIREKYNVEASEFLLLKILLGDKTDNIDPVAKGLKKAFLKLFVQQWQLKGFDKALNPELYPKIKGVKNENELAKLRDGYSMGTVQHNARMISLIKYQKPQLQFACNVYRVIPNMALVNVYNLRQFNDFLEYKSICKSQQT